MLNAFNGHVVDLTVIFLMTQALVDSPDTVRSQINFKRLSLTDIKIDIKRVPKKKVLVAAMEAAGKYSNDSIGVIFFLH